MYFTHILEPIIGTICYLKYKYKTACCFNYKIEVNPHGYIIITIICEVQIFKDKFLKLVYTFDNWAKIDMMCESLFKSVEVTDYSIQQIKNMSVQYLPITNL